MSNHRVVLALLLALAVAAPGSTQVYRAFGDSITYGEFDESNQGGYPPRLEARLRSRGQPGAVVTNHGLGGEDTASGLSRLDSVLALGGNYVLLMEGTNDVFHRFSTETIAFNMSEMGRKALARGMVPIHATVIPQTPWALRDPGNNATGALAERLRRITGQRRRRLADPFAVFLSTPNVYRNYYYGGREDPVGHPNAAGYDLLAGVFADTILAAAEPGTVYLDLPGVDGEAGLPALLTGSAIDPRASSGTGISSVRARLFPAANAEPIELGYASMGFPRPEIASQYGPAFLPSGFAVEARPSLPPGNYTLLLEGQSTVAGPGPALERAFRVPQGDRLLLSVDRPARSARVVSPVSVGGWALDPTARTDAGIERMSVWASAGCGAAPAFLVPATLGLDRPDIAQTFGPQFARSGFTATIAVPTGLAKIGIGARSLATGGTDAATGVALYVLPPGPLPAPAYRPRYRLYLDITKEHFFTTDANEYAVLGTMGWVQEGISYQVLDGPGDFAGVPTLPNFRLYNAEILQHFWTTDTNEACSLASTGKWSYEGVDGWMLPRPVSGEVPLYRLAYSFGPYHLWTKDANEYAVLPAFGWVQEGVVGWVRP